MQLPTILRSTILAFALAAVAAQPGCSKKSDTDAAEVTAENIGADNAITEQYEPATVSWVVQPDGKVKARIKAPDGAPIENGVTGKLIVKPMQKDAKPVEAKLEFDAKAGLYTAEVPKLEADLTEVSYELDVKGKPVKGAMHLPKGGTMELAATAQIAADVKVPEGKKGPNGGVLQIVGDDLIEIAADPKSGETRVYVLDDNLKPIPVGKRKVTIGVVASGPEMVALAPASDGMYLSGKLTVKTNPHKLTVVMYPEVDPQPIVVLCGWHPGSVVVVGTGAVVLPLFVAVAWAPVVVVGAPPVVVVGKGKGKGKWGWKHGGPKVQIHIH